MSELPFHVNFARFVTVIASFNQWWLFQCRYRCILGYGVANLSKSIQWSYTTSSQLPIPSVWNITDIVMIIDIMLTLWLQLFTKSSPMYFPWSWWLRCIFKRQHPPQTTGRGHESWKHLFCCIEPKELWGVCTDRSGLHLADPEGSIHFNSYFGKMLTTGHRSSTAKYRIISYTEWSKK